MAAAFAACGRSLAAFLAWYDGGQSIVTLDGARYCFLPLVVLGIAHHVAAHGDAAGNNVYVVVLPVRMAHDDSHAVRETHLLQVTLPDGLPLVAGQLVLRRGAHADVQHCAPQFRAQFPQRTKLCSQRARRAACHKLPV